MAKKVYLATDTVGTNGDDINNNALSWTYEKDGRFFGLDGNDTIIGGGADNLIYGGKGNDGIFAGGGNDQVWGGTGNDTIYGDGGSDIVRGGVGDDVIFGGSAWNPDDNAADTLYGGKGNDVLDAGNGDDALYGGSGDDYLWAGDGNQILKGGTGFDTADFSRLAGNTHIDVCDHDAVLKDGAGNVLHTYTIGSIEKFVGGAGDDSFTGGSGNNVFDGGAGNDSFRGMKGADTLTGGKGADTFVWTKKDVGDDKLDHVGDFETGVDKLDLSDFLTGQKGMKGFAIDKVVQVVEAADGSGEIVQGWVGGASGGWHDIVELDGVHGLGVHDLLA